jgi:hypothetical protein
VFALRDGVIHNFLLCWTFNTGFEWGDADEITSLHTTEEAAKDFIEHVNVVEKLIAFVTELHQCGHFSYAKFDKRVFGLLNLRQLTNFLEFELATWKSTIFMARNQHPCLNYFRSIELRLLLEALIDNEDMISSIVGAKLHSCLELFAWTGITDYTAQNFIIAKNRAQQLMLTTLVEQLNDSKQIEDKERCLSACLHTIATVLENTIYMEKSMSSSTMPLIFQPSSSSTSLISQPSSSSTSLGLELHGIGSIAKDEEPFKLVLVENPQDELNVVATIFHDQGQCLSQNASNVIICSHTTVWEEINLLLLRCFQDMKATQQQPPLCGKGTILFCVAYVEKLSLECQTQFLTMFQEMVKEWRQHQVGQQEALPPVDATTMNLVLVSCSKSANLLQNLSCNLNIRLTYHTPCNVNVLREMLPKECSKMWTVTSNLPGMGKTTLIRNNSNNHVSNC